MLIWDKLLQQVEISSDLLRKSNTATKVSAHSHLFRPFDFNYYPLAPFGCPVLIYVPTQIHKSLRKHTHKCWYLGCNLDEYHSHICVNNATKQKYTSPTVVFNHVNITSPTIIVAD